MSGIELNVAFDDGDEVYAVDNSHNEVETKVAAGNTDPRRRLEERLEEMRLKRELRELEFDYKF